MKARLLTELVLFLMRLFREYKAHRAHRPPRSMGGYKPLSHKHKRRDWWDD